MDCGMIDFTGYGTALNDRPARLRWGMEYEEQRNRS